MPRPQLPVRRQRRQLLHGQMVLPGQVEAPVFEFSRANVPPHLGPPEEDLAPLGELGVDAELVEDRAVVGQPLRRGGVVVVFREGKAKLRI